MNDRKLSDVPRKRFSHRTGPLHRGWHAVLLVGLVASCTRGPRREGQAEAAASRSQAPGAVGLALEVENGAGVPLRVIAGQTFYVNQIDLRTFIPATRDEGVDGLRQEGDFTHLSWNGVKLADEESIPMANPDGTYTRRRFYRGAEWMEVPSQLIVEPVNAEGHPTGKAITLSAGSDDTRGPQDAFFVRRFRAIQWTYNCRALTDCTGADKFSEEALVELRHARPEATTFTLSADTRALRLHWSLRPGAPYSIPVEQVANAPFAYGFSIGVQALTPPRPDGTYAPGSSITFQLTLRDGAGKPLHPPGSLPTYNEVAFGPNPAGIQYYRAFFDPSTTYYRRKHRERMLMTQLIGPAHRNQPIRSIIEMNEFLVPGASLVLATPERDGLFSQAQMLPPSDTVFGGAFDPKHAGWAVPVSDTWTYTLAQNAEPGTYYVVVKGRRTYMGEDLPASRVVEIQVGTPERTTPKLTTGRCDTCHTQGGELSTVLHALDNRAACAGCHKPLGFELEGPIAVRLHFIHSRSDRFGAPRERCSTCHLTPQGIQYVSKAACLSCHKGYPKDHVTEFGPIESMYVGGGRESFQQCTTSCHTGHPGSGL